MIKNLSEKMKDFSIALFLLKTYKRQNKNCIIQTLDDEEYHVINLEINGKRNFDKEFQLNPKNIELIIFEINGEIVEFSRCL